MPQHCQLCPPHTSAPPRARDLLCAPGHVVSCAAQGGGAAEHPLRTASSSSQTLCPRLSNTSCVGKMRIQTCWLLPPPPPPLAATAAAAATGLKVGSAASARLAALMRNGPQHCWLHLLAPAQRCCKTAMFGSSQSCSKLPTAPTSLPGLAFNHQRLCALRIAAKGEHSGAHGALGAATRDMAPREMQGNQGLWPAPVSFA